MENYTEERQGLHMSPKLKSDFTTAAFWARFIAITGMATTLLSALFNMIEGKPGAYIGAFVSVGFSVLVYIFLLRFGNLVKKGIAHTDQHSFNEGLTSLRTYYKVISLLLIIFIGIVLIVFICIILLAALKH